jgi:hypothetical protein
LHFLYPMDTSFIPYKNEPLQMLNLPKKGQAISYMELKI